MGVAIVEEKIDARMLEWLPSLHISDLKLLARNWLGFKGYNINKTSWLQIKPSIYSQNWFFYHGRSDGNGHWYYEWTSCPFLYDESVAVWFAGKELKAYSTSPLRFFQPRNMDTPRQLLYIICLDEREFYGPIKIGTSSNLDERCRQLQCGNPELLRIVRTYPVKGNVEACLHAAFAPYRLYGEWFSYEALEIMDTVMAHLNLQGMAPPIVRRIIQEVEKREQTTTENILNFK